MKIALTEADILRFWSRVDVREPDDCWPWIGRLETNGYAKFYFGGRHGRVDAQAHRVSFALAHDGENAHGHVDHLCHDPDVCALGAECPHRRCVNPAHLADVTPRQNTMRSNAITAAEDKRESCPRGHPYDYIYPDGRRSCRRCNRDANRAFRLRRKEPVG